jgi:hypothetical protein
MESLTPWEEHVSRVRGHELVELRYHWGEAYDIAWSRGMFRATRLDNRAAVNATTAAGLWEAIRDDYTAKPVPRDATTDPS